MDNKEINDVFDDSEIYPKKIIIGLTGGIGSGKSTVAKCIEQLGFPVYNSDFWAKKIVEQDEVIQSAIKDLLGDEAYHEDGKYNRKWVAEQVFRNDELLKSLNSIIHPAVKNHYENWLKSQAKSLVFKETALLFELGLEKDFKSTILVTADENTRIRRVMERDGKTYKEVMNIIEKQMPEKDKMRKADYLIENNEGLDKICTKVDNVLKKIKDVFQYNV